MIEVSYERLTATTTTNSQIVFVVFAGRRNYYNVIAEFNYFFFQFAFLLFKMVQTRTGQ